MEKGIVQKVVRSVPDITWTPGYSRCYRDTSYTKTKRKVRFNFQVRVAGAKNQQFTIPTAQQAIEKALTNANVPFVEVIVFDNAVYVYQEFPISITEE